MNNEQLNKEALARLRRLKHAAVDKMVELNDRARAEGRDLTEAESMAFAMKKQFATELNGLIADLESELFSAPAVDPAEEREARRARFAASMREMDELLGIRPTC